MRTVSFCLNYLTFKIVLCVITLIKIVSFNDIRNDTQVRGRRKEAFVPTLLDSRIRVTTQNRFTLALKTTNSTKRLLVRRSSQRLCSRCCRTLGRQGTGLLLAPLNLAKELNALAFPIFLRPDEKLHSLT